MRYFEDLTAGERRETGSVTVTETDIVAFAEQFDPQPMHTDPEAASESPYGGLIASGWHTASLCMRLLVDDAFAELATAGAVGVDGLRFRAPVRPGDTLAATMEVGEKEDWHHPDRGLVHCPVEVTDQDGETVLTMTGLVLFERRDDPDPDPDPDPDG